MPPFRRYLKKSSQSSKDHGSRRKAFHADRLAERDQGPELDGELKTEKLESLEGVEEDDLESSAEDEIPAATINPYNALLQALNAQNKKDEHRRKRRRLELVEQATATLDGQSTLRPSESHAQDESDEEEPEVSRYDEDEAGSQAGDGEDLEDPFRKHVEMNEVKLAAAIQDIKSPSSVPTKVQFHKDWKAIASGPTACAARQTSQKTPSQLDLNIFRIKDKLRQRVSKHFPNGLSGTAASLARPIFQNQDVLLCGRSTVNFDTLRHLICIHALNYVLKTRDRVLKNTASLSKVENEDASSFRDQGFTRPKVLFVLPTRQSCYRIVDMIVSLYEPEQQENRKRFNESFSRKDDDIPDDKPEDFRELFAGNDDDMFRIGIKLTRKTVKFFSQFYNSDVILASPLGLRMAMSKKDSNKEDFDFLSSIEVVMVDQAEALLHQNWEHVEHVFSHLSLQPKEHHGCDFSRVREWYLDGNARYLRQTIILSAFLTPELNQLANQHMHNIEGLLKITPSTYEGAIVSLSASFKQTFIRFDATSLHSEPDARFKAFTTILLPNLVKIAKSGLPGPHGILVFIPSYMDFVRLRNYMSTSSSTQDLSFGTVSEYASSSDVARARSHFLAGRYSTLLYSGRAHHFKRYKIKGVKKVVMYGIPDNPLFYEEVVGSYLGRSISEGVVGPEEANVRSLFCKWDILRLERVVGSKRLGGMLREGSGEVFEFQ